MSKSFQQSNKQQTKSFASQKSQKGQQNTINFQKFSILKQQIIQIRQRKKLIQDVPNPKIVNSFQQLHQIKSLHLKRIELAKKIQQKKKQYSKLKKQHDLYREKYNQKFDTLKQRPHLIKILTAKLQNQLEKTRQRYKQVQFNQNLINGVKKVSFYRLAQIFFNQSSRNVFSVIQSMSGLNLTGLNQEMTHSASTISMSPHKSMAQSTMSRQMSRQKSRQIRQDQRFYRQSLQKRSQSIERKSSTLNFGLNSTISNGLSSNISNSNMSSSGSSWRKIDMIRSDQQVGICLGYLGLLINLVGQISGGRMWMNFTFRGARSTIKLADGSLAILNYRDRQIKQGINVLTLQLYQIMKYSLSININPSLKNNFYYLVDELSKFLMS